MNDTAGIQPFLTPERVGAALAAPLPVAYPGAPTVGRFLAAVLSGVWVEGTRYDTGTPMGNGAWRSDIYEALFAARLVPCLVHGAGPGDQAGKAEADALIVAAIHQLCQPHAVPGGPLTARVETVASALDDSGEALAAALVKFISDAMDLSELGRAIGTEADELRAQSGQPVTAEIARLRAELARVTTERDQAVDALNQVSAGAP